MPEMYPHISHVACVNTGNTLLSLSLYDTYHIQWRHWSLQIVVDRHGERKLEGKENGRNENPHASQQ